MCHFLKESQAQVDACLEPDEAGYEETILRAQKDAEKILHLAKNQAEIIKEAAEAEAASLIKGKKRSSKAA